MLAPVTYYYTLEQGESLVGASMSTVDTASNGYVVTERLDGAFPVAGDTLRVQGSSRTFLDRRLALDSFAIGLRGDAAPVLLRGVPRAKSGVLTPTIVPVALMLMGEPAVGRTESFWMYNPLVRGVERVTARIAADSLFTVVDSATLDPASRRWVPARSDTVRGWSITGRSPGLTLWVDVQGRVIIAREAGGLTLTRTAYEIAFSNRRIEARSASRPILSSPRAFPTRGR